MKPTADYQVHFLTNLQRLLTDGQFVATYKYALLLALADLAVESGDDSGERLTISTKAIAEKFVDYYWRQAVPYIPQTVNRWRASTKHRQTGGGYRTPSRFAES